MLLFLGFFFTVFAYVAIGMTAGFLGVLLDHFALILVVLPLAFFLLASKSGKIIGNYITASFKKDFPYTKTELEGLISAVENTIKFVLATGIFSFITFVIISLGYIGAPERLGPSIAISLTSLTYSISISFFVFFPVQAWAKNKINAV